MASGPDQEAREAVLASLSKTFAMVAVWRGRIHQQQPQPEPGSSLSGDDNATSPHQMSHAVVQVLISAVDHFETLRLVVQEQHTLPARGGFTLVRAALENAAVAVWLLAPSSRNDRVFRLLRWEWADADDSHRALDLMAGMNPDATQSSQIKKDAADQRDNNKQTLQALAKARNLSPKQVNDVCGRMSWATILREAGDGARELTGDRAEWA